MLIEIHSTFFFQCHFNDVIETFMIVPVKDTYASKTPVQNVKKK